MDLRVSIILTGIFATWIVQVTSGPLKPVVEPNSISSDLTSLIAIQTLSDLPSQINNDPSSLSSKVNELFGRQDLDEDDEDDDDETTKDPTVWSTPRIKDFSIGLSTILNSVLEGNLDGVLNGSFQFIPPAVRPGVSSIINNVGGYAHTPETAPPSSTPSSTEAQPQLHNLVQGSEGGVESSKGQGQSEASEGSVVEVEEGAQSVSENEVENNEDKEVQVPNFPEPDLNFGLQ